MRRLVMTALLMLTCLPAAFADDDDRRWRRGGGGRNYYYDDDDYDRGRHRGWYKNKNKYRRPPARVYVEQYYEPWTPGYAVIPTYHRSRFQPVPVEFYGRFGPVPRGCRRAYLDGYVVDYRPSNFFVVSFGRAW